jgi:hypothetical protein
MSVSDARVRRLLHEFRNRKERRSTQGTGARRRRRWLTTGLAVASSLAAVLALGLAPALAVHDTGAFELDGNATSSTTVAGDDWDHVCHQVLGSDCSTTSDTSAFGGATAVDWVSEPNLNSTIFTGGGSKDPQDISNWAWKDGAGGLPDKDNLLHSFAAEYSLPPSSSCPSNGAPACNLLYFGSDRFDNSGDAQQGFWFFQNSIGLGNNSVNGGTGFTGVHKAGDVLVISDFSNGGTTSTITVYAWDPTCKKTTGSTVGTCGDANLRIKGTSTNANCGTAPAADSFCGIVNPGTITMPWPFTDKSGTPANGALNGEFYEGGLNLSAIGLGDKCFASVASETRSSTSTTATLKDFILGQFGACGSSTTTQSSITGSTSIGTGSVSVSDSATVKVTGISTWNGTVQFSLRGPIGSALETSTDIGGPVAVSNTTPTVSSGSATVTAAGDYCWSAHFHSTTTGVPDSNDNGDNECFTVTPVTPTFPTTAGPDVVLGNPVTDSANLSGTSTQPGTPVINGPQGPAAGGTITFTLLKDDCSTLATGTGTNPQPVSVKGNGTYGPVSFTPDAIGTYHWVATYTPASGDPNNLGSTFNGDCLDTNETVVVNSVASSMTSAQSFIPNDSAMVSAPAGGQLNGTMHFAVFEGTDCSSTAIYTQDVPVSGPASGTTVHTTNTQVSTTAANISWQLTYTSNNPAQRSIPASCFEHSTLTISNDGTISSP